MIQLLRRINKGYDGLIREISLKNFNNATIEVSVMDAHNNYEWINVVFYCNGLIEFSVIQKARYSNIVLSSGIIYREISGIHYIDFSPYSEEIDSVEEFRKSDIYFAAKEVKFETKLYTE